MKNKIYGIIIGMVLIFPVSTHALTTNNSVSCSPAKISSGGTVTCTFKSNITSGKLTGFSARYDMSEGVTYESDSFAVSSSMTALASNNNGFGLMNTSGATGNITLGTARFKINGSTGNYTINLKNIDLADENATSSEGTSTAATVRIVSSDNTLKSLNISPVNYNQEKISEIVKDTNNENIVKSAVVDADTIQIDAVANDTTARINGAGKHTLKYGINEITIKVTAENEAVKNYKITLVRPDNRSKNNYLSILKVNGKKLDFNKEKLEYEMQVNPQVNKLDIVAEPEDSKATVKIENNNIETGDNVVLIKVTAENESVRTYKIKVKKDNSLVVSVPNTAKSISIIVSVAAISLIIISAAVIYIISGKNNLNNKNK